MRASKTSGGATFYYLYDGSTVLCEINSSGNATNVFAYGAYGLAERYEAQNLITRAYSYDPSGNVVQRHSVKSGFPVADFTTAYDAYGQQLGCISPNSAGQSSAAASEMIGFSGQFGCWTDNESSSNSVGAPNRRFPWVWMGHREYDPVACRFLTRDPIGYEGGINLYAYAGGNPIRYCDPIGLGKFDINWWITEGAHLTLNIAGGATGAYLGGMLGAPNIGAGIGVGLVEGLWAYYHDHLSVEESVKAAVTNGVVTALGGKALQWGAAKILASPKILTWLSQKFGPRAFGFVRKFLCALSSAGCFEAGTRVQMADGSTIQIEQIRVGKLVFTRNPGTGKTEIKRVTKLSVHPVYEVYHLELADSKTGKIVERIGVTSEHPFYVEGKGFVPVKSLGIA